MSVPEKHRAVAHAWVDGAEVETRTSGGIWCGLNSPGWVEGCEYRIKPKAKIKKWRWVRPTEFHYTEEQALAMGCTEKIDSTMIEEDE